MTNDSTRLDLKQLSLQDALDLAILMEQEAHERYQEFTKVVGGRYKGDASDMFKLMAHNEAKHRQQLEERRKQLFGSAPGRMTRDMIEDVEAPDRGQPRVFMSAHQAMTVALRSEEKAYDFFDEALGQVKDDGVRKLFEELRQEELQHKNMVLRVLEKLPKGADLEEDEADEPGMDPGN